MNKLLNPIILTLLFITSQLYSACFKDSQCSSDCCNIRSLYCQPNKDPCVGSRGLSETCYQNDYCVTNCCSSDKYCHDSDHCKSSNNAFLIVLGVLIGLSLFAAVMIVIWKRHSIFGSREGRNNSSSSGGGCGRISDKGQPLHKRQEQEQQ